MSSWDVKPVMTVFICWNLNFYLQGAVTEADRNIYKKFFVPDNVKVSSEAKTEDGAVSSFCTTVLLTGIRDKE